MKLLLTRHGQSQWQTGTAPGPDAPLSALGVLQAHRLGEYLARRERPTRIVASPLQRARQTAEIAAQYLDLPVTLDADLREFDNWDAADPPPSAAMWQPDAATPLHPEHVAFCTRLQEALKRAIGNDVADEKVLIVAHGGTVGTLLRLLLGAPTMRIWTPNTALHSLRWTGEFWLLRYTNNQEHLPQPLRSR
ncbi:MAG: histidine phosphatase family protein [Anaerolineae bacterium]|nr:histidine phosphatase family protein [Anaerolineae bacterium]